MKTKKTRTSDNQGIYGINARKSKVKNRRKVGSDIANKVQSIIVK